MLVKFVPYLLRAEQKERHLSIVSHFLDCGEADENFFMNIVACGETWLCCYDLETEQISINIITMIQHNVPSLMQDRGDSCSFFIQEVVIHHECAAQNQIVHQQFYLELLGWLCDSFCHK